ncbi:MAG: lipase maturation factor family protein [Elusimicrobiota bacterium]
MNPALNLLSNRQIMNGSFDPVGLVNTYGAFGSVGKERYEVVLEGTRDPVPSDAAPWREYNFVCKPGNVMTRPCVISPFQPRLDWQIWFAAMSDYRENPWLVYLVYKLLQGDRAVLGLLGPDPFPEAPPRFIRAALYRYRFPPPEDRTAAWWLREKVGAYLPPLSLGDPALRRFAKAYSGR